MTTDRGRRPPRTDWLPEVGESENPSHAVASLSWQPLWSTTASLAASIHDVRDLPGLSELRPRFTPVLLVLLHVRVAGIRDIASALDATHSATSQTLAAMREEGLADVIAEPPHRRESWWGPGPMVSRRRRLHRLTAGGEELARLADNAVTARLAALAALFHETRAAAHHDRLTHALSRWDLTGRTLHHQRWLDLDGESEGDGDEAGHPHPPP